MGENDRGQTAIDFSVGMGVFFIALVFVFAFIPAMFDPFFGTGTGNALLADRSAAHLAETELVEDPLHPAVLDTEAVDEFFVNCEDPSEYFQTAANMNVNIGTEWTCDNSPPSGESVTASSRVVTIDDSQYILRVEVW